ncbi:nucleoside-diphosphate sugar epimerase [Acinetobacter sp. 187]|uniref:nucleoside-diphosphate sugar epimerase n=1 Tax=Acinetobacter lanii TaxID=2715163 RepID=UPI00140C24F0|nr:nucleoside-diphosphate sugar epimerase [Acinetobacter lanii]NHC04040.1 nucleoside-diphosphate sugar epimerase [Acinetobacter lanii]
MTKTIKRAVVIGATGMVGRILIQQLNEIESCEQIIAIVRREDQQLKNLSKVKQWVMDDFLLLNDQDVAGFSHAFSCLGTTIKKAGSKANFYAIDFEINAHFADLFEGTETHYVLISAQGAEAGSLFFYNQVKGELEQHLIQSDLSCISILRPSLLIGERDEARPLEDLSQTVFKGLSHLLPKRFKFKPVTAEQVAHTMVEIAQTQTEKLRIYDNLEIQQNRA